MKVKKWFFWILGIGILFLAGTVLFSAFLIWGDINPQHFSVEGEKILRIQNNIQIAVINTIQEDFESVDSWKDLISSGIFNSYTLQSPAAPTVQDYVQLRKCIGKGECDFIDNRFDISSEQAHSGKKSLRFFAIPPNGSLVSKSSLDTVRLHFAQGDDLWFSAWYFLEKGFPTTIADFETSAMKWGPGPRIGLFSKNQGIKVELKHFLKPKYSQDRRKPLSFPSGEWIHIGLHLTLSSSDDGVIEVWQGCEKIIDTQGKTLPKKTAILDRMQIGITATQEETILFVDDIMLSKIGSVKEMEEKCLTSE